MRALRIAALIAAIAHASEDLPQCALAPPQEDPCRFDITLVGGRYHFNGVTTPEVMLERGHKYFFDVQTSSFHDFAFGTADDGPKYEPADADDSSLCDSGPAPLHDRTISLLPGLSTPSELFYYCTIHRNMGGRILVKSASAESCAATAIGGEDTTTETGSGVANGYDSGSRSRAVVARHGLIIAHGLVMYFAFGLMLPAAAFLAHIGRTMRVRGSELSLHKILAPSAVLVGWIGVALAITGLEREGARHFAYSHGVIGLIILLAALLMQPMLMAAGLFAMHRKLGAAIILSALANIFLGLHLIDVPVGVQIAQVGLLGLLIMAYVLYRPQHQIYQDDHAAGAEQADPKGGGLPTGSASEAGLQTGAAEASQPPAGLLEYTAGVIRSKPFESRKRRTVQTKRKNSLLAPETRAASTKPQTDPEEAESALRGALSEAARARREGIDPALRGALRRGELEQMMKDILKASKLSLGEEEQAAIVTALFVRGDASGDGMLQFEELADLLATRGLRLASGGLEKLPKPKVVDEEDNELLPAFGHQAHEHELTRLQKLARRIEDQLPNLFWGTLWVLANIACFLLHFGNYSCWWRPVLVAPEYAASCVALNYAVRVAKGAGMALNFNCALVVLPMCRRTLTWLRRFLTVRRVVPLDSSYDFHVAIGWTIVFWTAVHCLAHYVNYFSGIELAPGLPPTEPELAINSAAGATGHVLLGCLLLMAVTALKVFRRATRFHIFIFTHHLFIIFFIVLLVHGNEFVGPNYYKFASQHGQIGASFPLTLYVLERAARIRNTDIRNEMRVRVCRKLAGGVTHLAFEKPVGFSYKPGQWAFIAVPALAKNPHALEYHPFTISSAPHEETIGFHIRSAGDWTNALHELAEPEESEAETRAASDGSNSVEVGGMRVQVPRVDRVIIDGPYGAASQEIFDHEVAVMVGAGIGVTPFASVLKSIKHNSWFIMDSGLFDGSAPCFFLADLKAQSPPFCP